MHVGDRMRIGKAPVFSILRRQGAATLALVAAHVAMMIAAVLAPDVHNFLAFSSQDVLGRFFIWELFSYVFAHSPSFWFVVEMYFFFWFGREVEQYLGTRVYLIVYALLVLAPALSGVFLGLGGASVALAGSNLVSLGVFVMFAFLYPRIELLFRIQVRWFAVVMASLIALQMVEARNWSGLVALLAMLLCAFECARRIGIRSANALVARLSPTPTSARRMPPQRPAPARAQTQVMTAHHKTTTKSAPRIAHEPASDSVDDILDKISRSGIRSLTTAERQRLESAREKLLEKDSR